MSTPSFKEIIEIFDIITPLLAAPIIQGQCGVPTTPGFLRVPPGVSNWVCSNHGCLTTVVMYRRIDPQGLLHAVK